MRKYYLAVDIGASSGRHILGWMEDGKIRLEESDRLFYDPALAVDHFQSLVRN